MLTFPSLLLLSSVALALNGATGTVISERQSCTPEPSGPGTLAVLDAPYKPLSKREGSFGSTTAGNAFVLNNGVNALFTFNGCPGGDPFYLTCVSCNPASSVVGVRNTSTDANGEPDNWVLFNFGNSASGTIPHRRDTPFQKMTWTWDGNVIQPVTANTDGTLQPQMAMIEVSNGAFAFSSKAKYASQSFVLTFKKAGIVPEWP